MNTSVKTETYQLPKEFWDALWQVRNHLLEDCAFSFMLCNSSSRNHPFVRAFWLIDAWMTASVIENDEWSA